MKFGDTLYRRSVPKWAAYNVNYNEIKRLIKERTSIGLAIPVAIPNLSSNNRWAALEDDLFNILKDQHNNISLFLKSKYGEIDRRLLHLEKQVRSAQKGIDLSGVNISPRTRRLHKLLEEAKSIGEDIQNLTRFASVQKTAFRKIVKKYRKWTGSTSLQARLDVELFATGQLNLDYVHPLERLNAQTTIITGLLESTQQETQSPRRSSIRNIAVVPHSTTTVSVLRTAQEEGAVILDASLATVPFGKSSGSAVYWIHPDNLEEAQALLLHYVREIYRPKTSRQSSTLSMDSAAIQARSVNSNLDGTYISLFDNPQRLFQDTSANRPSKVAFSARWGRDSNAIVTLSNLAPWNPSGSIVDIRRKDVAAILNRESYKSYNSIKFSTKPESIQRIAEYLSEHRDVKPLAQIHTARSRFVGNGNSFQTGTWAVLDTDIVISPLRKDGSAEDTSDSKETFPYAILEVRWEFNHTPELVRVFDTSHLAERVHDFSLELAALHLTNQELPAPSWKSTLNRDIRKIPLNKLASTHSRGRNLITGVSSGTSSTEGASDSALSGPAPPSSATSVESPNASMGDLNFMATSKKPPPATPKRKKKARIDAESPPPRPARYWNEFDDGDEDVNPQEAYTIYIDPDQNFPGAETVSNIFDSIHKSLRGASSRVSSIFSFKVQPSLRKTKSDPTERSPLLTRSTSTSDDADSSDSDSSPSPKLKLPSPRSSYSMLQSYYIRPGSRVASPYYRPQQLLTPRQTALENTYFLSYTGLTVISYILLFVSGMLIATGRKRDRIEVDIGVIAGIATAEICAVFSMVLMWIRRTPVAVLHWVIFAIAMLGILLIGVGESVIMFTLPPPSRKG